MVETDMAAPVLKASGNLKAGDEFMLGLKVKTPDEGADTVVYLALLPPNIDEPKGRFLQERKGNLCAPIYFSRYRITPNNSPRELFFRGGQKGGGGIRGMLSYYFESVI